MSLFANVSTRKTQGTTILKKNKMEQTLCIYPFQDLFCSCSNHNCVEFVEDVDHWNRIGNPEITTNCFLTQCVTPKLIS